MSVMTASIFIGEMHTYDIGIVPSHLIQVYEGDSIALVTTELRSPRAPRRWRGVRPDNIRADLLAMVALTQPGFERHPLSELDDVVIDEWDNQQLEDLANFTHTLRHLGMFVALSEYGILTTKDFLGLEVADVQILHESYRRVWNHDNEDWDVESRLDVDGRLPAMEQNFSE